MPMLEQIQDLKREVLRRPLTIAGIVMALSMIGLVTGIFWPAKYTSSTTVLIEEKKVIAPLLEGAAVPTSIKDRAYLAREVLFSRTVLHQILETGGWLADNPSPVEIDQLMDEVHKRTEVTNVGDNLIRITYQDSDPERAYRVTLKFAELFISESREAKRRESRQAFEFISGELDRYNNKLKESDEKLKTYLAANGNVKPGTGNVVDARIDELQRKIQGIEMDLEEAKIRKRSLENQLSTESATVVSVTRQNQLQSMIGDLQSQLATLRLNYKESYPDIVSTKEKIANLEDELRREAERQKSGAASREADENSVVINPLHQQLRSELSKVETQIAALQIRLRETRSWLADEYARGNKIVNVETRAADLTRDYEVNKAIYQDLLRRRESARISMNMDEQSDGLNMTIQEPPTVPLRPSGVRFIHFAMLSPLAAVAIALGLLWMRIRADNRIRNPMLLSSGLGIPLLTAVPMYWDEAATARRRREWVLVLGGFGLVFACYAVVGALRLMDIL